MKLHTILIRAAVVLAVSAASDAFATIPSGYYSSAVGKTTTELKTALSKIVINHTQVSSYNALPQYFQRTDLYPQSTRWWDMYSDIPLYLPWNGSLLNREHSLPKSWWGGLTDIPAYTDLNHLYPGEAKANQKKSNYPLGEVSGTPEWENGISKLGVGVNSGGAKYVFEPGDEYKGDFARTYFYMVTCYQDLHWTTTWQVKNGTYPTLQPWAIELLLKWHREDMVSEKELLRNEAVYNIQNNRNPFIDYPELAELIWGNRMGEAFRPDEGNTPVGNPTLIAPTQGMMLEFGQVAVGKTASTKLLIKGSELTSAPLRLRLMGKEFSIPGITQSASGMTVYDNIQTSAVNSASGLYITINYTPAAEGSAECVATLSGGGLSSTVSFTLSGEGMPMPVLTAPVATAATEVTDNSYVANWTAPAGEVIDYYVVTRKIYREGQPVETRTELAESNSLSVTDFEGTYETYSVHSVRLECDSPESEEIVVSRAAIGSLYADDAPFTVESFPGLLRVRCSGIHTGLTVYDMSGRTVMRIAGDVTDGYEFTLTPGAYLICTDTHRKPVKVIAR
ncbi:MAG: endonuclease [Muribaculaceae bacterium]|nr:endonuclease [Muribaculaceae bacterium]